MGSVGSADIGKKIDPYWSQQAPHRAISKVRPLRKAIFSQLALSSIELFSLKPPIFEGRRYE